MTVVRLVIEHATHPQREPARTWEGGELVIGRGTEAGWQLDDPDQFLSRRHAIVSDVGGVPHVTDASRGGLFVDGAATPLGPGNARALEDGMRLRLGDFVLRVEMAGAAARGAAAPPARAPTLSFTFGPADPPAAPVARPADLPSPFGAARPDPFAVAAPPAAARAPRPLDMDDPFALDLVRGPAAPAPAAVPPARPASPFGGASPFDTGVPSDPGRGVVAAPAARPPLVPEGPPSRPVPTSSPFAAPEPPAASASAPRRSYFFDDEPPAAAAPAARPADPFALGAGFRPATPVVEPPPDEVGDDENRTWVRTVPGAPVPPVAAPRMPPAAIEPPPAPVAEPPPRPPQAAAVAEPVPVPPAATDPFAPVMPPPASVVAPIAPVAPAAAPAVVQPAAPPPAPAGPDLYAAFLRGAGLPPGMAPADAERAMEDAGRHFRALVDGLMHLLRARAMEKQKVRVAQTVMASANVNPLKTLPTAEEGVAALLAPRGAGYLAPGPAIDGAFRDLADHQLRTWTALQSALRRMIDRFDPAEIEAEMEQAGRMKALLAGGRSALLWQLYEDRYREIARAAEERFLGEVGADFREAYEGQRRDRE